MTEGSSESTESEPEKYLVKARWAIPQKLDQMTFIGKNVLAVAQDIEIIFFNLKTRTELVYIANNAKNGDGVDCVAGHRTLIFAFAEKIKNPRIFIMIYPSLQIVNELKDHTVTRYKGLCMCENDTVAAFCGFPNYLISVWSWRTGQRLMQLPTGVIRRKQIYMSSRTHFLICQCWGEGLTVWEVAQCYKKCLTMRRTKAEKTGWEVSEPPLIDVCWTNEGQLYAIDPKGNLYAVLSDGIGMLTSLEWSAEDIPGDNKPAVCAFGNGILVYGPDNYLRALKKCEEKWKITSSFSPLDATARLVSSCTADSAVLWTQAGCVYRIGGDEDKIVVEMVAFKQRNVQKIQMIAPDYSHIAMIDDRAAIGIYEITNGKLVTMKFVEGIDVSFQASPVDPLLAVFGKLGDNYGMKLVTFENGSLENVTSVCLTHQIVTLVSFSPCGRHFVAAAMSAGHIFIYSISSGPEYRLNLVRYAELGRGLADCFLMKVGEAERCFSLVLFSDKYPIGERIICIDAETGRDNKFAGKMSGPYSRLLPVSAPDHMLAVPHLSRAYHLLKLSGEKGITVSVKMGPIIDSGHELKLFNAFYNTGALLTFGYDGTVVMREPHAPEEYEQKLVTTHRYDKGIQQALIDAFNKVIITLAGNNTVLVNFLHQDGPELIEEATLEPPDGKLVDASNNKMSIMSLTDKNYLDLQEEKKVHEEAMDYRKQREEVVRNFETIRSQLVHLLEENLREPPLHQLSLAEFNLHLENKKERIKQAEKEREKIRLNTEARIRAQDKVTAWIKKTCWDTMITPRVKLFAIFTHYTVENYPVLPTQMSNWPDLQQVEALRTLEMDNDSDLFKPWEETFEESSTILQTSNLKVPVLSMLSVKDRTVSVASQRTMAQDEDSSLGEPYVLSGSYAHKFIQPPAFSIPQTLTFSHIHLYYIQHITRLNVQNMRLWFNKQFDELVALKKREVGLVEERNARLRFIVEELNKLSDLRHSFHHLHTNIMDPTWRQEEQPLRLVKVEPEECAIEPYISPSQVVIIPPDPGPKDDFRERALIEMMDGVLEKLWHEEIKKPIPKPQCMLDKDPEHFNEDDLRLVFDYEAKVKFREEERDRYRKMLHAEYARLAATLDEGVTRFNQKVKETWLSKLQVDSVIGQETLLMMRLRRVYLDRVEMAEQLEDMRSTKYRYEDEIESLKSELEEIQAQGVECQAAYDALSLKDKQLEKTFKNHFQDLSPVIVDQCYKYYKKRPKWHQRVAMTPAVLYDLATAVATGLRQQQQFMHPDCFEYSKNLDLLDLISNMPAVMDEALWHTTIKLRRSKVENEIRMRAVVQEMAYVDSATNVWNKAIAARRAALTNTNDDITEHRAAVEFTARNKTIQIVVPAGQVEIVTSGHMEDFEDATLILRADIESINNAILKVGEMKLKMMRKQMEFRKGILSKEWEHAQWRMRLKHCEQELYAYRRLKIPKELQLYLKNKELGYTDEQDYVRMEKEMEATKASVGRVLAQHVRRAEEAEMKIIAVESEAEKLENMIAKLNVKVSEKRLNDDPLEPIRIRKVYKKRMESLVQRSQLIREVQANHTTVVLLQTELELLRLKTFPTLAAFSTFQ